MTTGVSSSPMTMVGIGATPTNLVFSWDKQFDGASTNDNKRPEQHNTVVVGLKSRRSQFPVVLFWGTARPTVATGTELTSEIVNNSLLFWLAYLDFSPQPEIILFLFIILLGLQCSLSHLLPSCPSRILARRSICITPGASALSSPVVPWSPLCGATSPPQ